MTQPEQLTRHGEDPDEQPQVTPGQHDVLGVIPLVRLLPPGHEEPDEQDDDVEADHPDQPRHVDAGVQELLGGRVPASTTTG